jgi:threonine dehydratase
MAQSLAAGRRVTLTKVDAFADGVAVKYVGAETFRLCRDLLDGVVLVDNTAISAAIKVRGAMQLWLPARWMHGGKSC